MGLNFEGLEMQKWNIAMNRTQKADENNGVVSLAIMFVSRVTVIKVSKIAHFLYFLLMAAKHYSQFGKNM